jgi:uncharacterized protein (UPF0264 family)
MCKLLVSVRSETEAEEALAGGADLIDVKEPARGSLGQASDEVISGVVRKVAGRRPVSAAMGNWQDEQPIFLPTSVQSLAFLKWGLANAKPGWQDDIPLLAALVHGGTPACRLVLTAYADWRQARSPAPGEIVNFLGKLAKECPVAFLVDTWQKAGKNLLDWMDIDALAELREQCRRHGVPVALAGSLGVEQIRQLRPLDPEWFAVRGLACRDGDRDAPVDRHAVARLAACCTVDRGP